MMAGALAACGAQADAEAQFDIAMNSGTYADVCGAARRAADDYLARGDQGRFERWRLTRDVYCTTAASDPHGRPADGAMQRRSDEEMRAIMRNAQQSEDPALRGAAQDAESLLNSAISDGGN